MKKYIKYILLPLLILFSNGCLFDGNKKNKNNSIVIETNETNITEDINDSIVIETNETNTTENVDIIIPIIINNDNIIENDITTIKTKALLGKVITNGYIKNAKVCIDYNLNFFCDENEDYNITNEKGDFIFYAIEDKIETSPIIVEINTSSEIIFNDDNKSSQYFTMPFIMISPPNNYDIISPFSLLVLFEMEDNPYVNLTKENSRILKKIISPTVLKAESEVKDTFNIDQNISLLKDDYIESKNESILILSEIVTKMQQELFSISNFFEEIKNSNSNINTDGFITSIVQGVVDAIRSNASDIKGQVMARDSSVDLSSKKVPLSSVSNSFSNIPYSQGMSIATGIDALTKQATPVSCIKDIKISEPICQNQVEFKFEYVENLEELTKHLGGSISGKVEVNLGIVSGGAKIKFNYSKEYFDKEEDIYILISANYINCSQSLINPKIDSSMEDKYKEDYKVFRAKCGDMYMDTVTTGGKFFGVLNIHNDEHIDKQELKAELNVYAKINLLVTTKKIDKSFTLINDVVKKFDENYNIDVRLQSNNSESGVTVKSADDFLKEFQNFLTQVQSDDCNGKGNYKECAYKTATYSDYYNIIDDYFNSPTEKKFDALNKLKSYYETYSNTLNIIQDIDSNPQNYYEYNKTKLLETKEEFTIVTDDIEKKIKDCVNDFDKCVEPQDLNIPSIDGVISLPMPIINYPRNCKEVKYFYNTQSDGDFIVYFQGDEYKPYTISCINMNTNEPYNYLVLTNKSSIGFNPNFNYVKSIGLDNYGLILEYNIKVYDALRINIEDEYISLLPTQSHFFDTIINVQKNIDKKELYFPEVNNYLENGYASLNINLEGLPFKFDNNISFKYLDDNSDVNSSIIELDETLKEINIKIEDDNRRIIPNQKINIIFDK